jgi:hypothetical protein
MGGWFNKLPGFQKSPAGLEWRLVRALPRVTVLGTALLLLPSLLAHLAVWLDPALESKTMPGMVDIYVIALVILHWTAVFTVAIGTCIVLIMKGPAYIADPYPLPTSAASDAAAPTPATPAPTQP